MTYNLNAFLKKLKRSEQGQALVETAVTIMAFLITVLGIIQLSLVMNAKLLTNYAAYCAARAGIVYNGSQQKMEQAAAMALAPLFAKSFSTLPFGFAKAFGTAAISGEVPEVITDIVGMGLSVKVLSPPPSRFASNYKGRFFPTLDYVFKSSEDLDDNLLKVEVTYHFPLEIPLVNTIMSPFFTLKPNAKIVSVCRMRMQSDALSD